MSDKLVSLVKKANARAFHNEVRRRLEDDKQVAMEAATFSELTLTGFDFSDIDLTHCAFEACTLAECRFVDTTLEGAFFDGVTLLDCHFEQGKLDGWAIDASTLRNCSFDTVDLTNNEWTDSRCDNTRLVEVTADSWWMERTTFEKGRWRQISIDGGAWSHVTLRGVSVNELDLEAVDITHCYHVDSAIHGGDWPEGFIEKSGRRKTL